MKALVALLFCLFVVNSYAETTCWRAGWSGHKGEHGHIQLWNPPDSGVKIVVDWLLVSSDDSNSWVIGRMLYPLREPIFDNTVGINADVIENTNGCYAQLLGGSATEADLGQMINGRGTFSSVVFFVLSPGTGMTVRTGDKTGVRASFRWRVIRTGY